MHLHSELLATAYCQTTLCSCSSQALWGIVSACTAAVNSFIGLAMCRLILGCVEAVFFPAALFYLSSYDEGSDSETLR
jgi:MFS family permease